jgi:hypothetical protein
MSKRGTTFYENAELASTISISYKRRPRFTVQVGFGLLGMFVGADAPASSALTQERLGWRPTGVGLISDLDHARDFES